MERLSLGTNAIGDAGLIAFADALEKGALPALKDLYLWHNQIGDEGMKALMAAANRGGLAKLKEFYANGNAFGAEGAVALAGAINEGNLPSLTKMRVPREAAENPQLRAACEQYRVELIAF